MTGSYPGVFPVLVSVLVFRLSHACHLPENVSLETIRDCLHSLLGHALSAGLVTLGLWEQPTPQSGGTRASHVEGEVNVPGERGAG